MMMTYDMMTMFVSFLSLAREWAFTPFAGPHLLPRQPEEGNRDDQSMIREQ